jgi:hypothetical protein
MTRDRGRTGEEFTGAPRAVSPARGVYRIIHCPPKVAFEFVALASRYLQPFDKRIAGGLKSDLSQIYVFRIVSGLSNSRQKCRHEISAAQ